MDFNYEELSHIVERYNNLTKESIFSAFAEALDKIKTLQEQNIQLSDGFDYWETRFNKLKENIQHKLTEEIEIAKQRQSPDAKKDSGHIKGLRNAIKLVQGI